MAAEEVDDARSAAQIGALPSRLVPGKEGLEQMHVRVGAPLALNTGRLEEAGHAAVLEVGIEERKGLFPQPQGVGMA